MLVRSEKKLDDRAKARGNYGPRRQDIDSANKMITIDKPYNTRGQG